MGIIARSRCLCVGTAVRTVLYCMLAVALPEGTGLAAMVLNARSGG